MNHRSSNCVSALAACLLCPSTPGADFRSGKTRTRRFRLVLGLAVGALWLASAGCTTTGAGKSPFVSRENISQLNLLSMPMALNLDNRPGADGFAVKVYASNPSLPKTVEIENGTLEILMFDGVVTGSALTTTKPLHVWSFPASDLRAHATVSSIGTGYRFTLLWGTDQPASDRATILARYTPAQGPPVYSASTSLAVVSH